MIDLVRTASQLYSHVEDLYRSASCGCGGDCGGDCDGNCDDCSCKDSSFSVSEEPMILPDDWDEAQEDDFLYAEAPLSDPGSRYEDSVEDEYMDFTILTEEQEEDFDAGVDALSKGRKYHDRKPVKNRSENRERRRDYERNPGKKRQKQIRPWPWEIGKQAVVRKEQAQAQAEEPFS